MKDEIKKLIEAALTDGVLTAKEREVILKKAVALGEDPDEVEIYLEAELQKVEQKADAAIRQAKGKTCPYCGGPIPQLTDKCPHCGQFITAQASEELKNILEALENALVDFKSNKDILRNKAIVEKYSRKAKIYYGNNPKIKLLLDELESEMATTAKKISLENKKKFIKDHSKSVSVISLLFFGFLILDLNMSRYKILEDIGGVCLLAALGIMLYSLIRKIFKIIKK